MHYIAPRTRFSRGQSEASRIPIWSPIHVPKKVKQNPPKGRDLNPSNQESKMEKSENRPIENRIRVRFLQSESCPMCHSCVDQKSKKRSQKIVQRRNDQQITRQTNLILISPPPARTPPAILYPLSSTPPEPSIPVSPPLSQFNIQY